MPLSPEPVRCSTIQGGITKPSDYEPSLDLYDYIFPTAVEGTKWIVSPGRSKEGVAIAIKGELNGAPAQEGLLLKEEESLLSLVIDNLHDPERQSGIVLVTDVKSVDPVTERAFRVLASQEFESGRRAYVLMVRHNTIFSVTETMPDGLSPKIYKFECKDGEISEFHPKEKGNGGRSSDFGDPGGSVLSPTRRTPPPKSLFDRAPLPKPEEP